MTIMEFFNRTKRINDKDLINSNKEMIDTYTVRHDDYLICNVVYNLLDDNTYLSYIYVANKDDSRTLLLKKIFTEKKECEKYSEFLHELCDAGNLDKIYNLIEKV